MSTTRRFGAPLLAAAQAQKHVTVNEALSRFDALAAPVFESRALAAPPADPAEGDVYLVAEGASGDWAGEAGAVAFAINGGWGFSAPAPGWRAWVVDEGREIVFDGARWRPGLVASDGSGAATGFAVAVIDHVLTDGDTVSTTAAVIPDRAVVFGVTARVIEEISGAGVSSFSLGAEGASGRYGSGYGLQLNAFAHGVTGAPVGYFGDTGLIIEADAGAFTSGALRLAVHFLTIAPPLEI